MDYCLNKTNRIRYSLAIGTFFLLSAVGLFFAGYVAVVSVQDLINAWGHAISFFILLLLGTVLFVFSCVVTYAMFLQGWRMRHIYLRKYEMIAEGIVVCYCNGDRELHPWNAVKEISICDVNQTQGGRFDTVIRIRMNTESTVEGKYFYIFASALCNQFEYWRHEQYFRSNYKDIIDLDYSAELLQQVMAISCIKPVDRRTPVGKTVHIDYFD